jgi:methyl-accepting chemotaxis protein
MITSKKQYEVSKQQLAMLQQSFEAETRPDLPEVIAQSSKGQLKELIDEVAAGIEAYEHLTTNAVDSLKIQSLNDLMTAPIRYRLAEGMSVDAFSRMVGVSARQIHRYEAEEYSNVNVTTLMNILGNLDVVLEGRVATGKTDDSREKKTSDQGMARALERITEVISLIGESVDRTSMLANNATIEAARAGSAGQGFAHVASEVRELANQTVGATEEISARIGALQAATRESVDVIDGIDHTISDINEITAIISSAVEHQAAGTAGVAVQNIGEPPTTAAKELSDIELAAGGVAISGSDNPLSSRVESLRQEVSKYLVQIKSAE